MPGIFSQPLEPVFTDAGYGQPRSHGHPLLSYEVLWGDRGAHDNAASVGRLACFAVRHGPVYKSAGSLQVSVIKIFYSAVALQCREGIFIDSVFKAISKSKGLNHGR